MKKAIKLLSLLLILPLASCGQSEETSSGSTRTITGKKKQLTYLISNESDTYSNILKGLLKEFNETIAADGYEIITEVPGGEYYQSLGSKFAAKKAPDIFQMEIGNFNAYKKYMEPLDSYIQKSSVLSFDDLWDLNDAYKYEGTYRALIKDFSPDFMFLYNKTLLEEYNNSHPDRQFSISDSTPMSWADFYIMVSTIQKEMNIPYGTSLGFCGIKHLHELVQSTGTSMYINDGKDLNTANENLVKGFEFYCALQKDNATDLSYYTTNQNGGKAPGSYTSGSNLSEDVLFAQRKTFSIFNGLYAFPSYGFYDLPFEVGIAPHPVLDPSKGAFATTSAMVSHAVSASSKYKDIAYKWVEYYQTEGLKRMAQIAYNIPGSKTIAGSDYFLKNDNPKVASVANYFYNFVASGVVHPTEYNPNISYTKLEACYTTHLGKYYDSKDSLSFSELISEIAKSVKAAV